MKNNICITGLLSKYAEEVAKEVSVALDTNFANLMSMVEFDIVDVSNTINVCGLDYYKEIVAKKLKDLATFENTTIFSQYYLLQYETCKSIFKNKLLTIYLDVGEKFYDEKLKDENSVKEFFPEFDYYYPITNEEFILIKKNTLAGIYKFEIQNKEIVYGRLL